MPIPHFAIHTCRVEVSDVDSYTLSFPAVFQQYFYGKIPAITAMAESTHSTDAPAGLSNINIHVDDINLTTQTAVLRFSANFTGTVNVRAVVT